MMFMHMRSTVYVVICYMSVICICLLYIVICCMSVICYMSVMSSSRVLLLYVYVCYMLLYVICLLYFIRLLYV